MTVSEWWDNLPANFRMAVKQAVSSISAIIITNLVDPASAVFTWPWAKHMLWAMLFLTLCNEARYWKQWADSPDKDTKP